MKLYIVVILAALCGSVVCGKAEWQAQAKECAQKHNVKGEEVRDAIHGKMAEADVTSDMKCFTLCMTEKNNLLKDGTFQPQVLAEHLTSPEQKEVLEKITSECSLKGADDCETAFKVVSCIAKHKIENM